jgi:hypothetical protein
MKSYRKNEVQQYWTGWYQQGVAPTEPSHFAQWVSETYPDILREKCVVDVCCGNGRDTYFLAEFTNEIVGVDFATCPESDEVGLWFYQADLVDFMKLFDPSNAALYCRFGLHAISQDHVNTLLSADWEYLLLEMRSDKNPPKKYSHYKRLINKDDFVEKIKSYGYQIIFIDEDTGYAAYGQEDPIIIRIVAKHG